MKDETRNSKTKDAERMPEVSCFLVLFWFDRIVLCSAYYHVVVGTPKPIDQTKRKSKQYGHSLWIFGFVVSGSGFEGARI